MKTSDPLDCEQAPVDLLLRLCQVEGLTVRHLGRLRQTGGTPQLPWKEGEGGRAIAQKAAEALFSAVAGKRADGIRKDCEDAGIRIVPFGSREYPSTLLRVPDAPLILFIAGSAVSLENSVAIVGSRAATGAAVEFAGILAADLASAGMTVVSGMARGIDAAAHAGALRRGGTTVAVLGCGVDVVYPPEASDLRDRILRCGSLISEYAPGTTPLPHRFPARNRIMSGISRGIVVVEAASRSGALITARIALEQGKEVMAVPGNPLFPHTAGSNNLIRDGAIPVTGAQDVIEALGWAPPPAKEGSRERRILDFLDRARRFDEISAALDIPASELHSCLLEMEMVKLLERGAGDYYKKVSVSKRHNPVPEHGG